MIRTRYLFVMGLLGLFVGCNYPLIPPPSHRGGMAALIEAVIRPPTVVAISAGMYWAKEKKWPASMADIAGSLNVDDEWRKAAAVLSDVSFTPQPDGSMRMLAICKPPGTEIHPAHVEAVVRVKKDPQSPTGYAVSVEPGAPKT